MQFGNNLINKTKDECLEEIAALASDPKTLVFFDTNIIAYLYKLHTAARLEFFGWTDNVISQQRLNIPAWSASEYLARVKAKQLHTYTPKYKDPDQPKKMLEVMLETTSLFLDDAVLRSKSFTAGRTQFMIQFRAALDALPQFTKFLKHEFDAEAVHEEIRRHLSSAILNSDLATLCSRAAEVGDIRVEHRLPPAFRDKSKEENRLGDLIIWFEILDQSKKMKTEFQRVIFITNDEKDDWVYSPQRRIELIRGTRKIVPNTSPTLKLIDPRLVAEFESAVGHSDITICSLPFLIEGMSRANPGGFQQLAAAIQIDIGAASIPSEPEDMPGAPFSHEQAAQANAQREILSEEAAANETTVEPNGELAPASTELGTGTETAPCNTAENQLGEEVAEEAGAAAQVLTYEPDAMRDGAYETDAPTEINNIISDLKSHNWYIQNPAIERIKLIRTSEFSSSCWFVLGRNIYQAACGNSQKAMEFVANLDIQLDRFPLMTAKHILAGLIFEIYFDAKGTFRDYPKAYAIEQPLRIAAFNKYADVREFITNSLTPHRNRLRFLPGDTNPIVLRIVSIELPREATGIFKDTITNMIQSVELADAQLLLEKNGENRGDAWSGRRFTREELTDNVSRTLVIPRWAIGLVFEPNVSLSAAFVIPKEKYFCIEAGFPG
jgi:hypothetical protein